MTLRQFFKSPERAMSNFSGFEWQWTKRDTVITAMASVACAAAFTLYSVETNTDDVQNDAPAPHKVVEVTE